MFQVEVQGAVVSTHSRPKAAAIYFDFHFVSSGVSTHSRPKAAEKHLIVWLNGNEVSTHSRPKAAGHPPKRATSC